MHISPSSSRSKRREMSCYGGAREALPRSNLSSPCTWASGTLWRLVILSGRWQAFSMRACIIPVSGAGKGGISGRSFRGENFRSWRRKAVTSKISPHSRRLLGKTESNDPLRDVGSLQIIIWDCRRSVYGSILVGRVRSLGIRDHPASARSPWQNGYAERLIGSICRECLDHIVVTGEQHIGHIFLRATWSITMWCAHSCR